VRAAILNRSWTLLPRVLVEEGIDCEYAPAGNLYVYRTRQTLEHDRPEIEWLHRLGVAATAVAGDVVEQMEPALLPGVVGGILHADDAQLRPNQLVEGLARRVRIRNRCPRPPARAATASTTAAGSPRAPRRYVRQTPGCSGARSPAASASARDRGAG
jgi:glycine/D-amino acid oxidase-like deaminating enzyme